tara:strand:- start:2470 stop:2799 length:330 start_codon:yes stop_codon:yes gene_type:complete
MIRLSKNKKIKTLKKVIIKDRCYNMPGLGYLNAGAILEVTNGPTRLSDVPFKVIQGSGSITHRSPYSKETKKVVQPGSGSYFFSQGHTTNAPYDFGTLSTEYFEVVDDY